ncbi:MAG: hypothetical protein IT436_05455 [Phycisphaerales bacterium]|nr:hypothetical protein [Phycisphaerales bacterium]
MAKAKDLMGRSGAIGLGSSLTPAPKPMQQPAEEHKPVTGPKTKNPSSSGGSQSSGGGKSPVSRRPKV